MKIGLMTAALILGTSGTLLAEYKPNLLKEFEQLQKKGKQASSTTCMKDVTQEACRDTKGLAEVAQTVCKPSMVANCINAAVDAEAQELARIEQRNKEAGDAQKAEMEKVFSIVEKLKKGANKPLPCTLAAGQCKSLSKTSKQILRDNIKSYCLTGSKATDAGWTIDPAAACEG